MRVVIAADIFPPVVGGPAIYAAGFSNALVENGDEVTVVSLTPHSDASVTKAQVVSVRQENNLFKYLEYLGLLFKHANQADIMYAMGPVNAGLPAFFAAKLLGKKFVVKVVGDYAWEQGFQRFGVTELIDEFQTKKYSGVTRCLQIIQKFVTRSADQVIVPSNYLKRLVVGWDVLADKITVIYNAVEAPVVSVVPKPEEEKWIVSVALLTPWKGMDTLIRIMPKILRYFPKTKLKIIGDGPEFEKLKKIISEQKLEESVSLMGLQTHETVLAHIKTADLFVLNSSYEGLSHAILEAHSFYTPVLASRVGGNPELVEGEEYLFTYNNAEEMAAKIINLLQKPKIQNRGTIESGFGRMVNQTTELLEKICGRS